MSANISSIVVIIPIGDITRNGRLKKRNHFLTTPPLKPKQPLPRELIKILRLEIDYIQENYNKYLD